MLRPTTTVTADDRDMTFVAANPRRGLPIWYLEPSRTPLELEDFKTCLFNIRRYNGALDWKLGQHLALGVVLINQHPDWQHQNWYLQEQVRAYYAAHDLHEAIVQDIVSGFKKHVPQYNHIERLWEVHVHDQIGLDFEDRPSADVRYFDIRALLVEMFMLDHPAFPITLRNIGTGPVRDDEIDAFNYTSQLDDDSCWEIIANAIETVVRK